MSILQDLLEKKDKIGENKDRWRGLIKGILKENVTDIDHLVPLLSKDISFRMPTSKTIAGDYGSEMLIVRRENDHSLTINLTDDGYVLEYTVIRKGGGMPAVVREREQLSHFQLNDEDEVIQKRVETALRKYVEKFI